MAAMRAAPLQALVLHAVAEPQIGHSRVTGCRAGACRIGLSASLRSPNTMAPGHASTQAGRCPASMRSTHSVPPSAVPLPRGVARRWSSRSRSTKKRAPSGQAITHNSSRCTVPVHQHDPVGAVERGAGRADIHARRFGAMLAHDGQGYRRSALWVGGDDLANHCGSAAPGPRSSQPCSARQESTQRVQPSAQRGRRSATPSVARCWPRRRVRAPAFLRSGIRLGREPPQRRRPAPPSERSVCRRRTWRVVPS